MQISNKKNLKIIIIIKTLLILIMNKYVINCSINFKQNYSESYINVEQKCFSSLKALGQFKIMSKMITSVQSKLRHMNEGMGFNLKIA